MVGTVRVRLQAGLLPEDALRIGCLRAKLVLAQVSPGRHDPSVAPGPATDGRHDDNSGPVRQNRQQELCQEVVPQVVHSQDGVMAAGALEDGGGLLEQRRVVVQGRKAVHPAGIEDQHVQPAHALGDVLGKGAELVEVRQVRSHRGRTPEAGALARELADVLRRLHCPLIVRAVHKDVRAPPVELDGRFKANARSAAGDEDIVTLQGGGHVYAAVLAQRRLHVPAPDDRQQRDRHGENATEAQQENADKPVAVAGFSTHAWRGGWAAQGMLENMA
mmetsp:Transcript_24193/g.76007  ORF Transcript_24193/g.76007 Transcript_24193/m.76007 type:complete len:275 (+) Transcript_24193:707-1531(+)